MALRRGTAKNEILLGGANADRLLGQGGDDALEGASVMMSSMVAAATTR